MKCPKCNGDNVTVRDSRRERGKVSRRRRCLDCDHRFPTIEITEEEFDDLKEKEKILKTILESVRRECIATVRRGIF